MNELLIAEKHRGNPDIVDAPDSFADVLADLSQSERELWYIFGLEEWARQPLKSIQKVLDGFEPAPGPHYLLKRAFVATRVLLAYDLGADNNGYVLSYLRRPAYRKNYFAGKRGDSRLWTTRTEEKVP